MNVGGTEGMADFDAKCAARPTCGSCSPLSFTCSLCLCGAQPCVRALIAVPIVDFAIFQHMQTMDRICCSERGSCAAGNPGASDSRSMDCALIYEPFFDDVRHVLHAQH